jgi:alpha-mannosidase
MMLKAEFPVAVNTTKAAFDIQFGSIERTTHTNTLWDFAQFEVCAHKWADMGDEGAGLSVINDCKYGYSAKDGKMTLTLLRSPDFPDPAADRELHTFTYSLYPHNGTWRDADTVTHGYDLNYPVLVREASGGGGGSFVLAACNARNVLVETIKQAEDGDATILRLYESMNKPVDCLLTLYKAPKSVELVNLLERDGTFLPFNGNEVPLTVKGYEIVTLKVKW